MKIISNAVFLKKYENIDPPISDNPNQHELLLHALSSNMLVEDSCQGSFYYLHLKNTSKTIFSCFLSK